MQYKSTNTLAMCQLNGRAVLPGLQLYGQPPECIKGAFGLSTGSAPTY